MRTEDQVVSLNLAQEMQELGAPQDSLFSWMVYKDKSPHIELTKWARSNYGGIGIEYRELYAAYTVAELGEMLKLHADVLPVWNKYNMGAVWFSDVYTLEGGYCQINEKTEADARGKVWSYLKREGLI